ncbi:MAG: phosphoribosylanthranilate isomerase [Deferribacteraceae bacterium]|jgi:phosphoribosylanthranilate isomerase|nr:phosphoribosylanthranilate isomerase [Deferribacteraceae bacterium]
MQQEPLIKICGLSRKEDVYAVNIVLPDFIGFIFAESRRRVTLETAVELKRELNPSIIRVGVFVNESIENIEKIFNAGVIDMVQLHGDEDDGYIKRLKAAIWIPVIKAVPMGSDAPPLSTYEADYILLDAYDSQRRGGSGRTFDWGLIKNAALMLKKPLFLAGGLNESNIALAAKLKPFCLDINSGVESNGVKDREKIIRIVRLVRGES